MSHKCGCSEKSNSSDSKGECNKNFKIANMKDKDSNSIKQLEDKLKMEMGKDVVLVAWEKE